MKNFLYIFRHSPYSGIATQEILDAILTTAAFDQQVSLLFLDDGVLQLKNKSPRVSSSGIKDTLSMFKALEIYDINDLYVETESLQEHGLSTEALALPIISIWRSEIATLLQQFDMII